MRRSGGAGELGVLSPFLAQGLLPLLQGEVEAATEPHAAAMDGLAALPGAGSPLPPWYVGPLLVTMHGDPAAAARARAQADHVGLRVAVTIVSSLRLAEAVEAGRTGDTAAADGLATTALDGWRDRPHLRSHQALALWLAAPAAHADGWGRPVDWWSEAEAWAATQGYAAIVDDCRARLRAAGAPTRRRRGSTPVPDDLRRLGVTGREVDVLALVAAGLTNAEIAAELHLSAGTVKGYVSQLLAKTGTAKRAGLAALAASAGIGPVTGDP